MTSDSLRYFKIIKRKQRTVLSFRDKDIFATCVLMKIDIDGKSKLLQKKDISGIAICNLNNFAFHINREI